MDIIYYHQYFITQEGSGGTRSFENAKALVKLGHNVTIVCGDGKSGVHDKYVNGVRKGTIQGINIIQFDIKYSNHQSFGNRVFSFIKFIMKSSRLVFTTNYDIIIATSTPLTIAIPGILAKLFKNKIFIFEVRDLWPELPKAMGIIKNSILLFLLSTFEYIAYKSADRIIALSDGMKLGIIKRGISDNKIKVVPNGCDIEFFNSVPFKRNSNKNFIGIYAGAHGMANGLNFLIDVGLYLKNKGKTNISILLIGDGSEKAFLQERVKKEKIKNIVFKPFIPKKNIVRFFKDADVGLQILKNIPAFYNGTSPNKFFDYLSAGLPVIINYPGEICNIIIKNNIGLAISSSEVVEFAEGLIYLSENKKILKDMSLRSKALASSDYKRKKLASEWCNWILERN